MKHLVAASLFIASFALPAAAKTSQPVDDASASAPVRVSTGVIAPKLEDSADLNIPVLLSDFPVTGDGQVTLSLTVDEKGIPQNIKVIKSVNAYWDARVVNAVSKFHYKPGLVDNQPIPVDLDLTVNIAR
jgi:TonB family protein